MVYLRILSGRLRGAGDAMYKTFCDLFAAGHRMQYVGVRE